MRDKGEKRQKERGREKNVMMREIEESRETHTKRKREREEEKK